MNEGTQYDEHTWAQLVLESGNGRHSGYAIEAMRRLVVATENQSRATGRLKWAIIVLILVQIAAAGVAILKVGL